MGRLEKKKKKKKPTLKFDKMSGKVVPEDPMLIYNRYDEYIMNNKQVVVDAFGDIEKRQSKPEDFSEEITKLFDKAIAKSKEFNVNLHGEMEIVQQEEQEISPKRKMTIRDLEDQIEDWEEQIDGPEEQEVVYVRKRDSGIYRDIWNETDW